MSVLSTSSIRLDLMCQQVGVGVADVLEHAGLPGHLAHASVWDIPIRDVIAIWAALDEMIAPEMLELQLAKQSAAIRTPSPLIAYGASENMIAGMERLRLFKSNSKICKLSVELRDDTFVIDLHSRAGQERPPISYFRFKAMYLLAMVRRFALRPMIPLSVKMPGADTVSEEYLVEVGCEITPSDHLQITFSLNDAMAPLRFRNEVLWEAIEPHVTRSRTAGFADMSLSEKTRDAILQTVSSGPINADRIAQQLGMSKRTLQRKLQAEGSGFQTVLSETRRMLANYYISTTELPMFEVAYLLGYNDASSFFRAYKDWTGKTPNESRVSRLEKA